MEPPSAGSVVSRSKLRPSIILADAGRGDYILCQVTSNPYSDPIALELNNDSISAGSLQRTSFARPGKLFTAHESIIQARVGTLRPDVFRSLLDRVIGILRP